MVDTPFALFTIDNYFFYIANIIPLIEVAGYDSQLMPFQCLFYAIFCIPINCVPVN